MGLSTPAEREAAARTASEDFLAYLVHTTPWFIFGHHHMVAIDALEAVMRGEITRLIVNVPPRHSKSEIFSRKFPAFFLGNRPDSEVMVASYGADLAYNFSKSVRGQFIDDLWPFDVRLKPGSSAVDQWHIDGHRGGLAAAGVRGPLTGKGANLFIIDDPHKDRKEADSPTVREDVINWYYDVADTRLDPQWNAVIIPMTRWHEGDLSGHLIEQMVKGGEKWTILNMPALAYEEGEAPEWCPPDSLGRKPGESLFPGRFPLEFYLKKKQFSPDRTWNSLYQQLPSTEQGLVFKLEWMNERYGHWKSLNIQRIEIIVDTAFKEGVTSAFSAAAVWAYTDTHAALLDVWRDQVGYETLKQAVVDVWTHWNGEWSGVPLVVVEDKASGQSLLSSMASLNKVPCVPFPDPDSPAQKKLATTSKEARADAATPAFKAKKILLPQEAPWLREWIKEHTSFPTGIFADQVDTTSMMVARFYGGVDFAAVAVTEEGKSYRTEDAADRYRDTGYNAERPSPLDQLRRRAGQSGYHSKRGPTLGGGERG